MSNQHRFLQIAAAVLSAFVATAFAQSIPGMDPKTQAEFDRIKGLSGLQRAIAATELTANFILNDIWQKETDVNKVPFSNPQPRVKAIFSETRQAPYVDGNQLVFPPLYYELLYELGFLVGHDIYIKQGHSLQVPTPLLNAPYGSAGILKLLEEPVLYLQNEYGAFMNPLITCSNVTPGCVRVQQTALSCNIMFVMGHELAHYFGRHGDRNGDTYPIAEELLADARAIALLKAYEPEILVHSEELDPALIRACYAAPAMTLQFEESTKTGTLREALRRRKDALLAAFKEDIRDDVEEIITPERSGQNLGLIEIVAPAFPQVLIIDGVAYPPASTLGARLYLPSGRHTIFAAKDGQYAIHSVRVGGLRPERIVLSYSPMNPGASEAQLAKFRKDRDWISVLFAASDGHLHARTPEQGYAHAEAMRWLKLAEWIDINDLRTATAAERRRVDQWIRNSQPLSSWR